MNRTQFVFGVAALGATLSVPLVPGSPATVVDPASIVGLLGLISIGLGFFLWAQQGLSDPTRTDGFDPRAVPGSDESAEWHGDRVGWRVDAALDADPDEGRVSPYRVRRELRWALDTALVERAGLSSERATELERAGSWTTDCRAATFLGEADVRPWSLRVRDWLAGAAFERNLRATVAEIDRLAADIDRPSRPGSTRDRGGTGGGVGDLNVAVDLRRLDDAIDEHAREASRSDAIDTTENDTPSTAHENAAFANEVSR